MAAEGVVAVAAADGDRTAALIDLVTPGVATEYWLGFDNFYVITRYNRSSFYAMSVFQLAEALRTAQTGLPRARSTPSLEQVVGGAATAPDDAAQVIERLDLDLANALTGQIQVEGNFLKGAGLRAPRP
jgi:hypothetical protein